MILFNNNNNKKKEEINNLKFELRWDNFRRRIIRRFKLEKLCIIFPKFFQNCYFLINQFKQSRNNRVKIRIQISWFKLEKLCIIFPKFFQNCYFLIHQFKQSRNNRVKIRTNFMIQIRETVYNLFKIFPKLLFLNKPVQTI